MPPTLDRLTSRPIGQLHNAQISLAHSTIDTSAWLIIEDTADGTGERLARLFYPAATTFVDRIGVDDHTWLCLPYTTAVDQLLIDLIDLCAELRRSAGIVQLTLTGLDHETAR